MTIHYALYIGVNHTSAAPSVQFSGFYYTNTTWTEYSIDIIDKLSICQY